MEYQLRVYTVRPGAMEEWLDEWRRHIVPLRRQFGFEVVGHWVTEGDDRFVWILGYEGEQGWAAADAAYYHSEERKSLRPDPARHLARVETSMMRAP